MRRIGWRWLVALGIVALLVAILPVQSRTVPADRRTAALEAIVDDVVDGTTVRGAVVRIVSRSDTFAFAGQSGNLHITAPYFIASTTKLYVTALIMQLRAQGRMSLDDRLYDLLPASDWEGLHRIQGADRTGTITVRQLLSHTSGIPDYFQDTPSSLPRLDRQVLAGQDRGWTTAEAFAMARTMTPPFAPGEKGKAHYSDTNYQLLGRIIEVKTGLAFDQALTTYLLAPLGLTATHVYRDTADHRPADIVGTSGPLRIPRAMASFGPDGGVVSTTAEQLTFLRAFFEGRLFPVAWLTEMQQWRRVFFPLESGMGLLRMRIPRWMPPFTAQPELIGYSGLSGAFAFYVPDKDVYITGTINSAVSPRVAYQWMHRLLSVLPDVSDAP